MRQLRSPVRAENSPRVLVRSAIRATCLALAALAIAGTVAGDAVAQPAASPTASPPPPAEAPEHEQLRALRDALIAAVNAKDADAILARMHPNVVLTTQDGKELRAVRGHAGVRDYLNRTLLGPERGVESLKVNPTVDDLSILYGGDTAVSFGGSLDHYRLRDGTEFDLKTRWSATLVKETDRWLVADLHVSANLFENPVLATLSRAAIWIGVAAGVTGLLIGLVLARFLRRRT